MEIGDAMSADIIEIEQLKAADPDIAAIWQLLEEVKDPEIPVVSLRELGILRDIYREEDYFVVVITPTYSGCPAMRQIEDDVKAKLEKHNYPAKVKMQLAPAWTTDWMTESGKEALREYGIAPPHTVQKSEQPLHFIREPFKKEHVPCPLCGSENTIVTSQFGSTACKALYRCLDCKEPFDYFKPY